MKKAKISVVIIALVCIAAMAVMFTACDGDIKDDQGNTEYTVFGNLNYKLIDGTQEYACIGTDKHNIAHIQIAEEVGGKKVTQIADGAFNGHSEIKTLTLPSSVVKIGEGAFGWCSGITALSLGKVEVSDRAFANCTRLAEITVSEDTMLGADAFVGTAYYTTAANWKGGALYVNCKSEQSDKDKKDENENVPANRILVGVSTDAKGEFSVADNTVAIAAEAFDGCYKLTGVKIPASVKSIGAYAFAGCTNAELIYKGSAEEWNSVEKGENWALGADSEVTCEKASDSAA